MTHTFLFHLNRSSVPPKVLIVPKHFSDETYLSSLDLIPYGGSRPDLDGTCDVMSSSRPNPRVSLVLPRKQVILESESLVYREENFGCPVY